MFEFVRLQYIMGNLSAAQVIAFAPKWITTDQTQEIIGGARAL